MKVKVLNVMLIVYITGLQTVYDSNRDDFPVYTSLDYSNYEVQEDL